MLNRTVPPPFKTIDKIDVIRAKQTKLDNGINVYTISAGTQEICKIEFVFRAGMYYQPATLVASTANNLLESGTRSFTADEISEGIDFYGSFLELGVEQDYATVTVYSLNKYLSETLRFVEEVIKYPVFPEKDFTIHLKNKRQKHAINTQKVSILARRKFSELLYGKKHPYGVDVADSDFERITVNEVRSFFQQHYNPASCTIIAAGNLPADVRDTLNHYFGTNWNALVAAAEPGFVPPQAPDKMKNYFERPDAIQSAVKVGRVLFNKTHPDYFKFQVLNSVLGGYFGSRLMANIREDKGYTYGIGSGINNLVRSGYFFISTEVGADVTSSTLSEIYKELKVLRENLIPDTELETVRNYMLGNFLRSVDGPFSLGEKFRAIWEYGLDYSFFDEYFRVVKSVTPGELRDIANQYLREEDMIECVVGKM